MADTSNGTTQEREQHMEQIFRSFYSNSANAGKDLSINKANEEFKKKYKTMLRNKKAYEIRASVKTQLKVGSKGGSAGRRAQRTAGRNPQAEPTQAQAGKLLIEGSAEQLAFLKDSLGKVGALFSGQVLAEGPDFLVIGRPA